MLKIYDKFETDFTSNGIAVLKNASNVKVKEVINGEYTLSFLLPRIDPKWTYIQPENFVKVNNQLFRIKTFKETRNEQGAVTSNVQCEHVWYDANSCKFIPKVELVGYTPKQILDEVFADTKFIVGTVDVTTLTDIFQSKTNPAKVVNQLLDNVGGEIIRDNYTINLVRRRGNNSNVQFRFGKNIKSLDKTTDNTNLTTRLYPYGKDDLDISTVNSGVAYIDSPFKDNYDRPHINYIDYKDIEDPTKLKERAIQEFSTDEVDGIDKPKITYNIDIVELKKLSDYGEVEAFSIGDTIKVIDDDLGINTNQRIVEYEYYPFEPKRSKVVLINYGIKQKNDLSKFLANLSLTSQSLESLKTYTGVLDPRFIENIREKLNTEINAVQEKALLHEFGDMYVDDLNNPTKALLFGAGIFAIANSKKENGDWNWRTIATGDRVVADEVDANWLYAGNITANQITGGTLSGITLNVSTDATIGNNLNLGSPANIESKSIIFSNASGGSAKVSYLSGDLETLSDGNTSINANGSVYIHGTKVYYNNVEIATVDSVPNLPNITIVDEGDYTTVNYYENPTYRYNNPTDTMYELGNHNFSGANVSDVVKHLTQAEIDAKTDWVANQLVEITDEVLPLITDDLTSSSTVADIATKVNAIIQALDGWMLRRS